jgi:hypothetical protein
VDLGCSPADGLERLLEGEHERTLRPVARAMNASSGSYFACCLPPKAPPGSGANTRTFAAAVRAGRR